MMTYVDWVLHDCLRPTAMLQSLAAVGLDGKGATGGPQRAKGLFRWALSFWKWHWWALLQIEPNSHWFIHILIYPFTARFSQQWRNIDTWAWALLSFHFRSFWSIGQPQLSRTVMEFKAVYLNRRNREGCCPHYILWIFIVDTTQRVGPSCGSHVNAQWRVSPCDFRSFTSCSQTTLERKTQLSMRWEAQGYLRRQDMSRPSRGRQAECLNLSQSVPICLKRPMPSWFIS